MPAALNDCHRHAADALKRHMHEVVPVMEVAGVLPHSHQQLACSVVAATQPAMVCRACRRLILMSHLVMRQLTGCSACRD